MVYFLDPIENIINLQPTLQTAIVAAERLSEILDLELEKSEEEHKKINPKSLKGNIEFKNVDFRYGTRNLILKNINMNITKGEKSFIKPGMLCEAKIITRSEKMLYYILEKIGLKNK